MPAEPKDVATPRQRIPAIGIMPTSPPSSSSSCHCYARTLSNKLRHASLLLTSLPPLVWFSVKPIRYLTNRAILSASASLMSGEYNGVLAVCSGCRIRSFISIAHISFPTIIRAVINWDCETGQASL
jgi:hypothetical protein